MLSIWPIRMSRKGSLRQPGDIQQEPDDRESYPAHAFCANKRFVQKSTLAIVPFLICGDRDMAGRESAEVRNSSLASTPQRALAHATDFSDLRSCNPSMPIYGLDPPSSALHHLPSTVSLHFRFAVRLISEATPLRTSTPPHDYALS